MVRDTVVCSTVILDFNSLGIAAKMCLLSLVTWNTSNIKQYAVDWMAVTLAAILDFDYLLLVNFL